jgi:anti-anti-sigma regulatory factor
VPTQITQLDNPAEGRTTLRLEGDLQGSDAQLLERIVHDLTSETSNSVLIDLADLDVIDSDSAPILRRLEHLPRVRIVGVETVLQTAIDMAERHSR